MKDEDIALAYKGLGHIKLYNGVNKITDECEFTSGFGSRPPAPNYFSRSDRLDYVNNTNVNVGRITEKNPKPVLHTYTTCFGSLDDVGKNEKTTIIFCGVPKQYAIYTFNEGVKMFDYFVNHSPYSSVMHPMSGKEAIENGIIIDAKGHIGLVASSFLMYKILYQKPLKIFQAFNELVEKGCNPHIAFLQLMIYGTSLPGVLNRSSSDNPLREIMYTKRAFMRYCQGKTAKEMPAYYNTGKYRGYGYSLPARNSTNDGTANHLFITKNEFFKTREGGYRDSLIHPLNRRLIQHLNRNGYNILAARTYFQKDCNLNNIKAQDVFIEWTKKEFPKLYVA